MVDAAEIKQRLDRESLTQAGRWELPSVPAKRRQTSSLAVRDDMLRRPMQILVDADACPVKQEI